MINETIIISTVFMSPRGGKREGSGRPKGTGRFGVPTCTIRVPETLVSEVYAFIEEPPYSLPLYLSKVQAGFPSPADDYIERHLDFNKEFIPHPAATFFLKATGESMVDAGIFPNDILLVDKSLTPRTGDIVIAAIDGELTVKRLYKTAQKVQLMPANPAFSPIDITHEQEIVIWGVVTLVLHKPEKR
jgi:DNA polymerase V